MVRDVWTVALFSVTLTFGCAPPEAFWTVTARLPLSAPNDPAVGATTLVSDTGLMPIDAGAVTVEVTFMRSGVPAGGAARGRGPARDPARAAGDLVRDVVDLLVGPLIAALLLDVESCANGSDRMYSISRCAIDAETARAFSSPETLFATSKVVKTAITITASSAAATIVSRRANPSSLLVPGRSGHAPTCIGRGARARDAARRMIDRAAAPGLRAAAYHVLSVRQAPLPAGEQVRSKRPSDFFG